MSAERAVYALLLGSSLAAGCAAPTRPAQDRGARTYLGELQDSDVRIAVVRDDESFVAYLCGMGATLQTHTRWFGGALGPAGETEVTADDLRLRFSEDEDGGGLSGQFESTGQASLSWRALLRDEDSEVGLYEARDSGCRSGVIVWQAQPGPACGAQGSFCNDQGQRGQVTPVACAPGMPLSAKATLQGETFEFVATRLEHP